MFTGKDAGYIYTLHSHLDCTALSYAIVAEGYYLDYLDGVPPALDELQESGIFETLCNYWRGQFPHVICRFELGVQKAMRADAKMLDG